MKFNERQLRLYAVTDSGRLPGRSLSRQVEGVLKGGATMVQLREKHLSRERLRAEALEIQALCRTYGVPFLINDDVDLALEVDADGVHVGQEDMEAGRARQRLAQRGSLDRMDQESEAFHQRVRRGYALVRQRYSERMRVIDADQELEQVLQAAMRAVMEIVDEHH